MEISFNKIKELMEKYGYFAEDELIWQTYINIDKFINDGQVGQDIHAICLEGPPGSGKSEYTKIYQKILHDILGEEVDLISYQCDSTTGKAELYEEIRVSAAIAGNPDEVIISGKLVEAIDSVNSGKKVILFLDEYDKAREETDAFLLQFLQEGKINTTQRGNVAISPENLGNIHVILCKNQMREELSGPLERRVKILRLSEMKPAVFYEVAKRQLPNANPDIVNAVAVLYGQLYDDKDNFARIPSCSESLMAIQDACTLMKAKAPREFICSAIVSNMLKNPNDIETFKHMLSQHSDLANFFKDCCRDIESEEGELTENQKLRRKMLEEFFSDDIQRLSQDIERVNQQIREVNIDHQYLEGTIESQKAQLAEKDKTIAELSSSRSSFMGRIKSAFTPQAVQQKVQEFVKIGEEHKFTTSSSIQGEIQDNSYTAEGRKNMDKSVFDFSDENWNEIGYAILEKTRNRNGFNDDDMDSLVDNVFENCESSLMCKDGFVVAQNGEFSIIAVKVIEEMKDDNGDTYYEKRYKFFSNKLVIPIYMLDDLMEFTHEGCYHGLNRSGSGLFLECLVTGEEDEERGDYANLTEISENLYHLSYINNRQDLEDASCKLQGIFDLSQYSNDNYSKLRRMLERLAINKHRDMVIDGRLKSDYVLPIEKVKGLVTPDSNDGSYDRDDELPF